MQLTALTERVICRKPPPEKVSAGGIVIPDRAAEKMVQADVIAVGPGDRDEKTGAHSPMGVKVGDRIIFGEFSGQTVRHEGEDLFVIRERDIFAVVEPA